MFEAAEIGQKISKTDYKEQVPNLRQGFLDLQQRLRRADFPVIVLFAGVDAAGKGETVNLLNFWMDPRWLETRAYLEPSQEEAERPEFWRYWRDLPARGRIGLFLSAWYSKPTLAHAYEQISTPDYEAALDRIVSFETDLVNEGALFVKLWLHLGKKAQKRRLKNLESDPLTSWRVTKADWQHWNMYQRFIETAEIAFQKTSTGYAPWTIVEAEDERYRNLKVGAVLMESIEARLGAIREKAKPAKQEPKVDDATSATEQLIIPAQRTILSALDMKRLLDKKAYTQGLTTCQGRINKAHREAIARGVSTIMVFEGWDASGKGGAIRRVATALDARRFQVHQIAAPTDEEQEHHYLWRFWRHLDRSGRVTIFDRSWYGRVLVERVEGFATEEEWHRAYAEINDFETQLVQHGIVLVKYWIHVTPEEQLARFKDREQTPYKRWKITDEDWRNRARWEDYEVAVHDMIERTSTRLAPWTLIEGNDKRYARVRVMECLADALEKALAKEAAAPEKPQEKAKGKS